MEISFHEHPIVFLDLNEANRASATLFIEFLEHKLAYKVECSEFKSLEEVAVFVIIKQLF